MRTITLIAIIAGCTTPTLDLRPKPDIEISVERADGAACSEPTPPLGPDLADPVYACRDVDHLFIAIDRAQTAWVFNPNTLLFVCPSEECHPTLDGWFLVIEPHDVETLRVVAIDLPVPIYSHYFDTAVLEARQRGAKLAMRRIVVRR